MSQVSPCDNHNVLIRPDCSLEASSYQIVRGRDREVQEPNGPEVHAFDIEVVKFRASFTDQAPQNGEAASMFLDKLTEGIFLLKVIVNGQTNGDLEITYDVTMPKRLALEIGETGVVIRAVR